MLDFSLDSSLDSYFDCLLDSLLDFSLDSLSDSSLDSLLGSMAAVSYLSCRFHQVNNTHSVNNGLTLVGFLVGLFVGDYNEQQQCVSVYCSISSMLHNQEPINSMHDEQQIIH